MRFGRIVAVFLVLILAGCGANGGGGQGGETAAQGGGEQPSTMAEDTVGGSQATTTAEDNAGEGTVGEGAVAGGGVVETITVREAEFTLDPANITVDEPGVYVFRGRTSAPPSTGWRSPARESRR